MDFLLKKIVERNDQIVAAGVRRADGELVVSVGDHESTWNVDSDKPAANTRPD